MLRVGDITVPRPPAGAITDEATLAVLETHGDLVARAQEASTAVDTAARAVDGAREQDRQALSRAIRDGRADPGRKKVEQAERDLTQARRQHEALMLAALEAKGELEDVVKARRATLAADAAAQTAEAREVLRGAIADVRAAAAELAQASVAESWCRLFPDPPRGAGMILLDGLVSRNGSTYTLAQGLVALDALAAEPEEVAAT